MLANAVEHSGEAISITDAQGRIQYVNPAFTALTGYSVDEALHQPSLRLLGSAAHSAAQVQTMLAQLRQGQCWQGRLINKRKDGSYFPAATSISPIKNQQGKIAYYITIQNDDTPNQQAHEKEMRDAKMKALATTVGGIAHEFNNILTGIMGNAYLVQMKEEDETLKAKLDTIEKLGEKAAGMVQQMLVYVGYELRSHKHVWCDIRPVVQASVEVFTKEQGLHCQLQAWHEPLMAYIDPHAITEAMMQMLSNAQDAVAGLDTPEVQVQTLRIAADTLPEQAGEHVSHYACIRVLDNGATIPDDIREAVFEPFFTTKEVGKGTGLGLSTVYGIAKEHHGFVKLEDSRQGCSFFTLCATGGRR